jgi:hypothetical protein
MRAALPTISIAQSHRIVLGCAAAEIAIALIGGKFFRLMRLKSFVKVLERILYPQLYSSVSHACERGMGPEVSERARGTERKEAREGHSKDRRYGHGEDGEPGLLG